MRVDVGVQPSGCFLFTQACISWQESVVRYRTSFSQVLLAVCLIVTVGEI